MLTYLDESYAINKQKPKKEFLLIGALFLPSKSSQKHLQEGLRQIKLEHKFLTKSGKLKEIKYSELQSKRTLLIAKKAVDLFVDNAKAFFRVGIIEYAIQDLEKMKKLSGKPAHNNIKRAMLYTKIVENLIKNNYTFYNIKNGVLLMDYLTRCNGDRFNQIIAKKLVNGENKFLKHFSYVDSKSEENQTIQICDLLLGAVRNNFFPTRIKYKTEFKNYVNKKLSLPGIEYWKQHHTQVRLEAKYSKLSVRFYRVPYQY
jgi:hypothetical protein